MDGERFDAIARLMTGGRSRRALVRAALGSAGAGALSWLGAGEAAAQCREPGRNCGANADCCTRLCRRGVCRPCRKAGKSCRADANCCLGNCRGGECAPCRADERCSGGRCCPAGSVACPGSPAGCLPASTACSGEPVCCAENGQGAAVVCGFQGECPAGSAPPPATCPAG